MRTPSCEEATIRRPGREAKGPAALSAGGGPWAPRVPFSVTGEPSTAHVGLPARPSSLQLTSVVLRELSLIGSAGHVRDEDTRTAVSLIAAGDVAAAALITHRLPLEHAVSDGIALLAGPDRWTALKIIVSPGLAPRDRAERAEPAVDMSAGAVRGGPPS